MVSATVSSFEGRDASFVFDPGGGVRVCAAHMGGFLGQNSLNNGPFFGRFSINMGALSRNWRKIAKNGPIFAKVHHESGYDSKFW